MFCLSPAKQYRVLKYSLYLILPIQKLLYIYTTSIVAPVHCLYDIPLIYSYILTVYYVSLLHPHPNPLPPPHRPPKEGGEG